MRTAISGPTTNTGDPPPIPPPAPVGRVVGSDPETGRDAHGIQTLPNMLASWSPTTLMDCFLLYADPQRAVNILGAILAAILLFWGAVWFFITYVLPWLRGK